METNRIQLLAQKADRPYDLILIRHAESARNRAKKGSVYFADEYARRDIAGIPDHLIDITPEGRKRAEVTGVGLRQFYGVPDYLYHSGYKRTVETANGIIAAYTDEERARIKIRANIFIRERDAGHAYDMTEKEAEGNFPYLKEYWKTFGGFFAVPPGGESLAQMAERVYLFLNKIFRDRAGQKVFVVTHGGTIRLFRYLLERWTYEKALKWPDGQSPKNCGMTVYRFSETEKRLKLVEYNRVFNESLVKEELV